MIAFVDVAYADPHGCAACVLATSWTDATAAHEVSVPILDVAPYVSGQFYQRELPALRAVLAALPTLPSCVVVDGYVWLDDKGRKGLGAHLRDALDVCVVGVAKKAFADNRAAVAVVRGASNTPLYVTAAGMAVEDAAEFVRGMHGRYRIPTLLKRADTLCRAGIPK